MRATAQSYVISHNVSRETYSPMGSDSPLVTNSRGLCPARLNTSFATQDAVQRDVSRETSLLRLHMGRHRPVTTIVINRNLADQEIFEIRSTLYFVYRKPPQTSPYSSSDGVSSELALAKEVIPIIAPRFIVSTALDGTMTMAPFSLSPSKSIFIALRCRAVGLLI